MLVLGLFDSLNAFFDNKQNEKLQNRGRSVKLNLNVHADADADGRVCTSLFQETVWVLYDQQ